MPETITKKDRKKVESFNKIGEDVFLGEVKIQTKKCTGCGFCVNACAASALEVKNKKAQMIDVLPMCMGCGDCVAICPENAIELVKFIEFNLFFKYIDRGHPEWPRRF